MRDLVRNPAFKILFRLNVVVAIMFVLNKILVSLSASVGSISFKLFEWDVQAGKILKFPLDILSVPCGFIGGNIKTILVIDVIFLVLLFLMKLLRKEREVADNNESSAEGHFFGRSRSNSMKIFGLTKKNVGEEVDR